MTVFTTSTKVQTRGGCKARILATDLANSEYPIAAAYSDPDGTEYIDTFTPSGQRYKVAEDESDIVVIPETLERFLNLGDAFGNAKFAACRYNANHAVFKLVTLAGTDTIVSSEIVPKTPELRTS